LTFEIKEFNNFKMKSENSYLAFVEPGNQLLGLVRSGFILQGTNLSKWCAAQEICRVWATDALTGKRNGPKAQRLRLMLVTESKRQNGR
jgi:hypothetical protein